MSYSLFVDSTKCSGFRKYSCEFHNSPIFWSKFEWYNVLSNCLWNPKQQKRSKKSSNVAASATNLILEYCGFRSQCTKCTVWPRNAIKVILLANYMQGIQKNKNVLKNFFSEKSNER